MINKWIEGPGRRTCEVIKFFQKGESSKLAIIEVKNEFKETVCFQVDTVHVCHKERGLNDVEMLGPYLSRKTFPEKEQAFRYCKDFVKKEDDEIKEAAKK